MQRNTLPEGGGGWKTKQIKQGALHKIKQNLKQLISLRQPPYQKFLRISKFTCIQFVHNLQCTMENVSNYNQVV
jgi:hypothetical protein